MGGPHQAHLAEAARRILRNGNTRDDELLTDRGTSTFSVVALLLGMIDVRGAGVPAVDLKGKLGIAKGEADPEHGRIVVLEIGSGERRLVVGIVADAVYEVTHLTA